MLAAVPALPTLQDLEPLQKQPAHPGGASGRVCCRTGAAGGVPVAYRARLADLVHSHPLRWVNQQQGQQLGTHMQVMHHSWHCCLCRTPTVVCMTDRFDRQAAYLTCVLHACRPRAASGACQLQVPQPQGPSGKCKGRIQSCLVSGGLQAVLLWMSSMWLQLTPAVQVTISSRARSGLSRRQGTLCTSTTWVCRAANAFAAAMYTVAATGEAIKQT
jgi:hypothetical protein